MVGDFAIWQKTNQAVCQLALDRRFDTAHACRMATTAIRSHREQQGLTLEELAHDAQLSVSQLSRIETGKREPRLIDLERIAVRLGVGVPDLLPDAPPVLAVPLVSWVSAGRLWTSEPVMEGDETRRIGVADLPKGDWIALEVEGDSMDRIAPPGSVICVNRADKTPRQGKFYVVTYDDGRATFKQYRANPVRLQPYSTNPDHETIYPDENTLKVVGKVYRVITDLK